jgi:hypothetical protein
MAAHLQAKQREGIINLKTTATIHQPPTNVYPKITLVSEDGRLPIAHDFILIDHSQFIGESAMQKTNRLEYIKKNKTETPEK